MTKLSSYFLFFLFSLALLYFTLPFLPSCMHACMVPPGDGFCFSAWEFICVNRRKIWSPVLFCTLCGCNRAAVVVGARKSTMLIVRAHCLDLNYVTLLSLVVRGEWNEKRSGEKCCLSWTSFVSLIVQLRHTWSFSLSRCLLVCSRIHHTHSPFTTFSFSLSLFILFVQFTRAVCRATTWLLELAQLLSVELVVF